MGLNMMTTAPQKKAKLSIWMFMSGRGCNVQILLSLAFLNRMLNDVGFT